MKLVPAIIVAFAIALAPLNAARTTTLTTAVKDQFAPLPAGALTIEGHVGERIALCIKNRLMLQNTEKILDLYRTRDKDPLGYHGEFFGKWASGAALACRYQANPQLQQKLDQSIAEVIETASPNGYISTYKPDTDFQSWDLWNQKYALLGLIGRYDETGNKAALDAAVRSASHVIDVKGPGKQPIDTPGPRFHNGGVNYSILEPIALLYERTGDKKFADFGRYMVDSWEQPSAASKNGIRLIDKAEAGEPLTKSYVLHAYTLMSDFEGLAEMYRATGEPRYLDATLKLAREVEQQELMIHGSVSNQEFWCDGAATQTNMLENPAETCATFTWIKLCNQLLRLTGNPHWADQMEHSLYNGLLGAMMPHSEWWSYDSELAGERVPSRMQATDLELSCCVSNGPRGLLLTPEWAVMSDANGLAVNLYAPGSASTKLPSGKHIKLTQETDYPANGLVTLTVETDETSPFELKLRIPKWSEQTVLKVNGETVACRPGSYAAINRIWKTGDTITLDLDLRGRIIPAPSGAPQQSIMRGPIVLACDNRLLPASTKTVWLIPNPEKGLAETKAAGNTPYISPQYNLPPADQPAYIDVKFIPSKNPDVWLTFEVPFVTRTAHFIGHHIEKRTMCDFSSAGDEWSATNLYRIWLPQPMYLAQMYPPDTWKIMNPSAKTRPTVPEDLLHAIAK